MSEMALLDHLRIAFLFIATFIMPFTASSQIKTSYHPISNISQTGSFLPIQGPIEQIVTSTALPNVIVVSFESQDAPIPPSYSLDGGYTWQFLATTPWEMKPMELALAPRPDPQPVRVLALQMGLPSILYRTGDFGAVWASQGFLGGQLGWAYSLIASPANPQHLYLSASTIWYGDPETMDSFVYMTEDSGVTWTDILSTSLLAYGTIALSPVDPTKAYVELASGWVELETRTYRDFPVDTLVLDGHDPLRMYGLVMDYTNPYSPTVSGGQTSLTGGDTWSPWPSLPKNCKQLMAHPTKEGILYLRCQKGLFKSSDSGDQWKQISPLAGDLLAPNYGNPGQILWARPDGLWASDNDGANWFLLDSGRNLHQIYLPSIFH